MLMHTLPPELPWRILAGYTIFLVSYVVFAAGKLPGMRIDRPGMAVIGAVAMVALRVVQPGQVLGLIDFPTIVLLFSMMLLAGFLHLAGFFDWVGGLIATRLPARFLLPAVIFGTGVLSAFFVNDIICLVVVPFVLTATRRMGLKPLPYMLAIATASNIGSVATITGNPQNMLIGSVSHFSYRVFLAHLGPVAFLGLILDWLVLTLFFGSTLRRENPGTETAARPLEVRKPVLRDMRKPALVMAGVVIGFLAGAPPALMAAVGAAIMLITRSRDPQTAYSEVNWDLLVFFVGLFVIVGGAEAIGLTSTLLGIAQRWNLHSSATFTIATALLSNIVSNVPAVMVLKTLVPSLSPSPNGWLLLAMASTLAGNLTITGSIANLIVVQQARGQAYIGFWDYFRVGLPITVLTLAMGWLWLVIMG